MREHDMANDAAKSLSPTMRAIVHDQYGSPDLLVLREVPVPDVGAGEVLVRVRAASVHVGDLFGVRGAPFPVRFDTGLFRPTRGIPGYDVAGVVEAVGDEVTRFQPGDEVFGQGRGTCAERTVAKQDHLAPAPTGLDLEAAATLAVSGLAALHGLRDAGRLRAGQRVLVNGASGGVGTFAVQIAKALGAEVTGVCGPANLDLVGSLGADAVIDHTREDFTRGEARYDLILDNVENHPLAAVRSVLTLEGTLVVNSGTGASGLRFYGRLLKPMLLSPFVKHRLVRFLSMPNATDLGVLKDLVEAGTVRPVVDRTVPLEEVPAVLWRIAEGHQRGKVVVRV